MGNYISHWPSEATGKIKLILSGGTVHEFDRPLTVAELMLEHPQQVVVEFRPLVLGARPTPLPADEKLEMEKVYMMLPLKRGRVVTLSADEARRVLVSAKSVLKSGSLWSSTRILPLIARICPAGFGPGGHELLLHRKDEMTEKQEKSNYYPELLPETFDERPEYLSRQFSGKGWKPALDTIKEKSVEKKIPHWLF